MDRSERTPADHREAERRMPKGLTRDSPTWGRVYWPLVNEIRNERDYRALLASAPPLTTNEPVRSRGGVKLTKKRRKANRRIAKWDAAYAHLPGYVQR